MASHRRKSPFGNLPVIEPHQLPRAMFHATPWRLQEGSHLAPRWSQRCFDYRVFMTNSLRAARGYARAILEYLTQPVEGGLYPGGFAGMASWTRWIRPDLRSIRGAWIYRVRPTGPVGGWSTDHMETAYPLEVLHLADTWGEPWRNELGPAPRYRDRDMARLSFTCEQEQAQRVLDSLKKAYRSLRGLDGREREEAIATFKREEWIKLGPPWAGNDYVLRTLDPYFIRGPKPPKRDADKFFHDPYCNYNHSIAADLLRRARDEADLERRFWAWMKRAEEEVVVALRHSRRVSRRRRKERARYRRSRPQGWLDDGWRDGAA